MPFDLFHSNSNSNSNSNQKNYIASLSDNELIFDTKEAIQNEREAAAIVVRYFQEIYDRELYLKHACSSLFQFVTEKLGYCAASAQSRINAMKLIQAVPEVEEKIESGELSLTSASKIQSFMNLEKKQKKAYSKEQATKLVSDCLSKTTREVERELAKRNPDIAKVESVKPVGKDRFQVSFSISEESEEKVKKLKSLFAHSNPNMTTEELFEKLLELGLEKFDPARKAERSEARVAKKQMSNGDKEEAKKDAKQFCAHEVVPESDFSLRPGSLGGARSIHAREVKPKAELIAKSYSAPSRNSLRAHEVTPTPTQRSRHIPAKAKHQTWLANQNGGCEFKNERGEQCGSKHALQIDHIKGFALGGSHNAQNLRVLCAKHNRFEWRSKS